MSLFSDETIITVSAALNRIVQDVDIASPRKVLGRALYTDKSLGLSVSKSILKYKLTSTLASIRKYLQYASDISKYAYGLPDSTTNYSSWDSTIVNDALIAYTGGSYTLTSVSRVINSSEALDWYVIQQIKDIDYRYVTNDFYNGFLALPTEYKGYTQGFASGAPPNNYISVLEDDGMGGAIERYRIEDPTILNTVDIGNQIVIYYTNGSGDPDVLVLAENDYPGIITQTSISSNQDYFPVVPLVRLYEYNDNTGLFLPTFYSQFVGVMDTIRFSLSTLVENVRNTLNPDIQDAHLLNAVPIQSTNQLDIQYCFRYFKYLIELHAVTYSNTVDNELYIQEDNFIYYFLWKYAGVTTHTGVKAAVGEYAIEVTFGNTPIFSTEPGSPGSIKYYYQTNSTTYEQVEITDLSAAHVITIGTFPTVYKGYPLGLVNNTASYTGMVLPLNITVFNTMDAFDREELFLRSLYISVYSHKVEVLDWYEQDWFVSLVEAGIQAAALVASAYAGYAAGMSAINNAVIQSGATAAQIAANATTISLSAGTFVGISIASTVLFQPALTYALKSILKVDDSFIQGIAIIASAAISGSITSTSFTTAGNSISTTLNFSHGVIRGLTIREQVEYEKLINESNQIMTIQQAQQKILANRREAFEATLIDPLAPKAVIDRLKQNSDTGVDSLIELNPSLTLIGINIDQQYANLNYA